MEEREIFLIWLEKKIELGFYSLVVHEQLAEELARLQLEGEPTEEFQRLNDEAVKGYEDFIEDIKKQKAAALNV